MPQDHQKCPDLKWKHHRWCPMLVATIFVRKAGPHQWQVQLTSQHGCHLQQLAGTPLPLALIILQGDPHPPPCTTTPPAHTQQPLCTLHIIPALWAAIALFSEASLNAHPLHFFDHHLQFFLLIYFFFHVFLFHLLVM